MFSKLLKYEWKANANLLSFLSLGALGTGVLGGVLLRILIYIADSKPEEELAVFGASGLSTMIVFAVLAIFVYAFAVQFITLSRFYKNKFTDEGYLTFTLPVNAHQIFISSMLNILAWFLISILVVLLSVSLIVIIGAGEHIADIMSNFQGTFGWIGDELGGYSGYELYQTLTSVQQALSPLYSIVMIMSCLTVGAVLAKKHKVLAAIGIYYGAGVVLSIITSILTATPSIILLSASNEAYEQNLYNYMSISTAISMGLQVVLVIGGYFLSTGLMKRKLNLP